MVTTCPYCKRLIDAHNLQENRSCPYCGRTFAAFNKLILYGLLLGLAGLMWLCWSLAITGAVRIAETPSLPREKWVHLPIYVSAFAGVWLLADLILWKVFSRPKNPAYWIALAAVAALFLFL